MWAFLPPETLDPEKDPDEPEPEENEGLELNFVLDWLPLQRNLHPALVPADHHMIVRVSIF